MVKRHFLCVGLLLLAAGQPNQAEDSARTFLTTSFQVSSAEVDRIDAGHVVVRTLGATDPREVATLGVVRIRVTPEFYAERLADIVTFKRTDDILQIGTFGALLLSLTSPISRSMNGTFESFASAKWATARCSCLPTLSTGSGRMWTGSVPMLKRKRIA